MKKRVAFYITSSNSFFYNLVYNLHACGVSVTLINPKPHVREIYKNLCDELTSSENSNLVSVLKESAIDTLVVWNGSNNLDLIQAARAAGVKIWFLENGYLPATLQMNTQGVNAFAEYTDLNLEEIEQVEYPSALLSDKAQLKILSESRFSLVTYLRHKLWNRSFIAGLSSLFKIMTSSLGQSFKRMLVTNDEYTFAEVTEKPYIFFPLQVNSDTQIQQHSHFKNMQQILDSLLESVSELGYNLVIKEHPAETEFCDYKKYSNGKNVFVVRQMNLEKLIDEAAVVVTVNSSVGFQTIARNKKVVTLGNAFYNRAPGVFPCNLYTKNLIEFFQNALSENIDHQAQRKYVAAFAEAIFIKGDWRKPTAGFVQSCIERILS